MPKNAVFRRKRSLLLIWRNNQLKSSQSPTIILPESRAKALNNGIYAIFTQSFD
ncbi:hypothetical protein J7E79_27470 [Bacillus sp. ISL-40]|uniref:hypothetical protein n=1 Tax=unclassified Bacillus (in: firmicutes) TaxID=185979 RepID=UPI001BE57622|nr:MULTISPECIES: hypothetical protein [unclassified Bacillus (in: firmicutes)]MBT2701035.1 hypothetical protein [Bacillus sp. ISL-40]MBT2739309.1 hypothetical protein [Bacillus sp. ISL-77]